MTTATTNLPSALTLAAFVAMYAASKAEHLAPVAGCALCARAGHRLGCREHSRAAHDVNGCEDNEVACRVYLLTAENAEVLRKAIARLAKRADVLGVEGPSMVEAPVVAIPVAREGHIGHVARVPACVTGRHPQIAGWTFVAAIDHTIARTTVERSAVASAETAPSIAVNVIHRAPHALAKHLDARWWTAPSRCDHCATCRARKRTYLLNDGQHTIQVGSNCVADYLGGVSADHLAMIAAFEETLGGFGRDEDSESGSFGGSSRHYVSLVGFLAHVAHVIAAHGWVSRAAAEMRATVPSTCDLAIDRAFPGLGQPKPEWDAITYEEAHARAEGVLAWVRGLFDGTAEGLAALDDYQRNLVAFALAGCCGWRDLGIVASMFAAKARADGETIARKFVRGAPASEHFGAVGKRAEYVFTVERVFTTSTLYGELHIHTMRDDDGRVAVWKTAARKFSEGDRLAGKGTVKAHGEYRGVKQTELARCDFEVVPATAA